MMMDYAFGVVELPADWKFPDSDCCLQLVREDKVFGEKHLVHCIRLVEKAFDEGNNVARSKDLELLLRLAGTNQVSEAIKELKPRKKAVLIVFGGKAKNCYEKALGDLNAEEAGSLKEKKGFKEAMERAALVGV